ncbi:MAG: amidohydrolase [Betaproteobacteria bacterium]
MSDFLFTNGKVITVDGQFSIAEAIAVEGARIKAVGRSADLAALKTPKTKVIDLKGRAVMPGLHDGHAHVDREGLKTIYPSLGRVRSIADIQARIGELARKARPGEWIVTMPIGDAPAYFDVPGILKEKRWPTRQELDEVAPDNPVYIRPIWGFWRHTTPLVSIANTRALKLAGIDRNTPPPAQTVTIEKDAQGEPSGVFLEETMMPIIELTLMRRIPGFTRADRARTLPASFRAYHAFGTTSIFEEHGAANELVRAYKDARRDGTLTMRSALVMSPNWTMLPKDRDMNSFVEAWAGWLGEPSFGDDWLKLTGIYCDFVPSQENVARRQASPYTGWAGFNYDTALPRERAKQMLLACARNDIRAIGIWPQSVDLFYEVHKEIPLKGRRWIFGHISMLPPQDLDKVAEMELVLTSHTNRHVYKEGHIHKKRIGEARETEISPLKSILERGLRLNLATDNVPVSLFYPVWQSVARRSRYTKEIIAPSERLSRRQALEAATINGAWLTFDEMKKGSLEPGKLADLAVLDADPLTCEEDALRTIAADLTMVGGRVVYERGEGENPAAGLAHL